MMNFIGLPVPSGSLAKHPEVPQMRENELKKYKEDLEVAINEVLTEAPEIRSAIDKIREEGYDVYLMVEATIGFNKCDEGPSQDVTHSGVQLNLTSQDEKFLRQLKINPK